MERDEPLDLEVRQAGAAADKAVDPDGDAEEDVVDLRARSAGQQGAAIAEVRLTEEKPHLLGRLLLEFPVARLKVVSDLGQSARARVSMHGVPERERSGNGRGRTLFRPGP